VGKTQSLETRLARSESLKETRKNCPHRKKGELAPQYGIGGTPVYLYNIITKELDAHFPSVNSAVKNIRVETLKEAIAKGILIKDTWIGSFTE
jgi:hypothetical protein